MGFFGSKHDRKPPQKKGVFGRLAGIFRSEAKPSTEQPRTFGKTAGTRGYALGTRKQLPALQREGITGVKDWTTGRQWTGKEASAESMGSAEVDAFVLEAELITVHSTWLAMAQYFRDEERMFVEFRDGFKILVNDISERDAVEFAIAPSKGIWFWTFVLGYGTRPGHRLKTWTVV